MESNVVAKKLVRTILTIAFIFSLTAAFLVALSQPAQADHTAGHPVPNNIRVPAGSELFFVGHAVGTQNYICAMSTSGAIAWSFSGPQATLFDDQNQQVTTHFLSPIPPNTTTGRATWQHSQDTSTVWAVAIASSSNPGFVEQGAIPWLLLDVVGAQNGPTGGDFLSAAEYIQRLNTSGGVAPTSGCTGSAQLGTRAFVPYTADYYFYR